MKADTKVTVVMGDSRRIGTVRDARTTFFLIFSFCSIFNFIRQMLKI